MKKLFLPAFLFLTVIAKGQVPKDTTKITPIHYGEIVILLNQANNAQKVLHSIDMSSKKRDSIDAYWNDIIYFLKRRAVTTYADTVKKKK